jgi:WD40 repeat protein
VTSDGWRAVSASYDQTLKVWELETGHALRTLQDHAGPVNAVAVTPDGRYAVSASADQTLKVWELESGRAPRTLQGSRRLGQLRCGDAGRPTHRFGLR